MFLEKQFSTMYFMIAVYVTARLIRALRIGNRNRNVLNEIRVSLNGQLHFVRKIFFSCALIGRL